MVPFCVLFRQNSMSTKYFSAPLRLRENIVVSLSDLNHLHGVYIVQNIPIYRVGGSVAQAGNGMSTLGVVPNYSWAEIHRIFQFRVTDKNEIATQGVIVGENNKNNKEEYNREDGDFISSLSISADKRVRVQKIGCCNLDITGVNIHQHNTEWDVVTAAFNRTGAGGKGIVNFSFPVAVFGSSYNFQNIQEYLNEIVRG